MKAIILAGGEGTRLYPLTSITNKHLLPVYNKPVISYAVEKLAASGIKKILIITSPRHMDQFKKLLGNGKNLGKDFGVEISYALQDQPRGIAHGLRIGKKFIGKDNCLLWLGDGVVEDDLAPHLKSFKKGARIFLKKVIDPERFGVATVDKKLKVTEIVEKPKKPKSDLAVIGVYLYDNTVFKKMAGQPLSDRGEYEITYVNNQYAKEGTLEAVLLKKTWFDIGTFESLFAASTYIRKKESVKNKKRNSAPSDEEKKRI